MKNHPFYGAIECDIEVPPALYDYFSEYSPLFANTKVPFEKIGAHMQDHVNHFKLSKKPRRLLVGGMKGEKILLASDLLRWYMLHGMVVTQIHQVVEYIPSKCFAPFVNDISTCRRHGDRDKSLSIISDTMKLIGNSAYGSSIMDKEKHLSISYAKDERTASLKINCPRFKKLTELADNCYEVESFKRKIVMDVPIQLGYFVLQYAKLRMLEFHYDCIDVLLDRSCYQLMETDTDSLYYALSGKTLDETIANEKRLEYHRNVYDCCNDSSHPLWFPRKCCAAHSVYDNRTPGLFKCEYTGTEMVALCSKTYIVSNQQDGSRKFSCKGVSRRSLGANLVEKYKTVLDTQIVGSGVNTGFRSKDNHIFTYTQTRCGFTYFYCKREVLADGINTQPLDIVLAPSC